MTQGTTRAVAFLAALVLGLLLTPTAGAHSYLRSSDPADGSVLAQPPQQVVMNFSDPLIRNSAAVTVSGPQGTGRLPGEVDGSRLTAEWPPGWGGGRFRVSYRAASQDGHVMEGGITFRIKGGAGTADPAGKEQQPSAVPYPDPPEADSAAADATAPAAVPVWVWALGGTAVVAAGGLALLARRRG